VGASRIEKAEIMLVFTRRPDEQIVIGDDIVITVLSIRGPYVRLGIDAPVNVSVHRGEVYELIRRANQAEDTEKMAAQSETSDPQK